VADGRWARVGSTNLNVASWIGNRELDVVVEDEGFARAMEAQDLKDLDGATEVVLNKRRRVRLAGDVVTPRTRRAGGSAGRAAAGALRLGNALGAALSPRKLLGPAERRLLVPAGLALVAFAPIAVLWPQALAWPLGALALWLGFALLLRAARAPKNRAE
jgi:cardiolipin synthase